MASVAHKPTTRSRSKSRTRQTSINQVYPQSKRRAGVASGKEAAGHGKRGRSALNDVTNRNGGAAVVAAAAAVGAKQKRKRKNATTTSELQQSSTTTSSTSAVPPLAASVAAAGAALQRQSSTTSKPSVRLLQHTHTQAQAQALTSQHAIHTPSSDSHTIRQQEACCSCRCHRCHCYHTGSKLGKRRHSSSLLVCHRRRWRNCRPSATTRPCHKRRPVVLCPQHGACRHGSHAHHPRSTATSSTISGRGGRIRPSRHDTCHGTAQASKRGG